MLTCLARAPLAMDVMAMGEPTIAFQASQPASATAMVGRPTKVKLVGRVVSVR